MPLAAQFRAWVALIRDADPKRRNQHVCRVTGLSHPYVSRILRDELQGELRLATLEQIADHMGVPISVLVAMIEAGSVPPQARIHNNSGHRP